MAGNFDTLWARYRTLILFWLLTLVLIVTSLLIQLCEADLSNRFAVTRQSAPGGIQVTVTYPAKIFLPSAHTPSQELSLRVTAPDTVGYVIWIEDAPSLVFYDEEGNAVIPRWQGQGSAVFCVMVRAVPGQNQSTMLLQAGLSVDSFQYPIPLGQVITESLGQSRWRIGLGIFARNIALPLSLLSAIAGWVLNYLGKESDKAENTFRENLSKLSADFDSDPLFAVTECIDWMNFAQKKHLDYENIKNLQQKVSRLCHIETLKKITRQLSDLAEQGEKQVLLEALRGVLLFFDTFPVLTDNHYTKFVSSLRQIYYWLNESKTRKRLKEGINGTVNLWDQFDLSSLGLVIHSLSQLPLKPKKKENTDVREALEKTPHRKRLIRYQKLAWMIDSYHLTLPGEYEYINPFQPDSTPKALATLYADFFDLEKLLEQSWSGPTQWKNLTSLDEFGRFLVFENDANILLRKLWRGLTEQQKRPREGVFPIYWKFIAGVQSSLGLDEISHQVAEAWLEFLTMNPDAFLDLRSAEQDALVGFLGWHVGSLPALLGRLRQHFLQVKSSSQAEKDILLEKVASANVPYGKDISPNREQLLDWLNIRPPWLTHTVLIVFHKQMPSLDWQQAVDIYQRDLLKQKFVIKEIVLTTDMPAGPAEVVRWSDDDLMKILKSRTQRVSRDSFTALFEPLFFADPLKNDRELVQKSKGSLGRMIELGQKILDHHAASHPDVPDLLMEDDFQAIENL